MDSREALDKQDMLGNQTFDEFVESARTFHGYPAPGLLIGAYMVEYAKSLLPEGILFDAISETASCLPDAVQMLTPCTVGNGWLRVLDLGLYALSLYDKRTGEGVRVYLDSEKLEQWPHIKTWLFKLCPKREQDSVALRESIRQAGASICSVEPIRIREELLGHKGKGAIGRCELCGLAYPVMHGPICLGCQGKLPYEGQTGKKCNGEPELRAVPVEEAVGKKLLHDMTRIEPGVSKGVAFQRGQHVEAGDVCRLQHMGRFSVYLDDERPEGDWVHEDEAAKAFAEAMAGPGVALQGEPREGKVNLVAERPGLLLVDVPRLERFNFIEGVMAASRKGNMPVKEGARVAATRAIPLFLPRAAFLKALAILGDGPIFEVREIRQIRAGVLVTGNEVFQGLIEDKFEGVIREKLARYGCEIARTIIVPDDAAVISRAVEELAAEGCELILTTAGLSVDPGDVTRKGLMAAGAEDMLYGMPILFTVFMLFLPSGLNLYIFTNTLLSIAQQQIYNRLVPLPVLQAAKGTTPAPKPAAGAPVADGGLPRGRSRRKR